MEAPPRATTDQARLARHLGVAVRRVRPVLLTMACVALVAACGSDSEDAVTTTGETPVADSTAPVTLDSTASEASRPRPSLPPPRTDATEESSASTDTVAAADTEPPPSAETTVPPTTAPSATTVPAATTIVTETTSAPDTTTASTRPTRTVPGSVPTSVAGSLPDDPRAGYAEGDPGTVSLALTEPIAVSGWAPVPVSCSVTALTYTASFSGAAVTAGVAVSASITAAPYRGAGSYPGAGTLSITYGDGQQVTVPLAAQVTVADDLAGSVSLDVTSTAGVSVAGTLVWHCSA